MFAKFDLKHQLSRLLQAIVIALAILGFSLQQLVANPTTALIIVYWFIVIMAIGFVLAGLALGVWMGIKISHEYA